MIKTDFLIVGGGLAGSVLAYQLIKEGKSVLIIDESQAGSSSAVAAGVFNPITGRRAVKTWMADELFPYAKTFYEDLEIELGSKFYFPKNIFRPFKDIADQNDVIARSNNYGAFTSFEPVPEYLNLLHAPFGGINIKQGGFVIVNEMLKSLKSYFNSLNLIFEDRFDFDQLKITEKVNYKDIEANHIIFCEGYKVIDNPFFNHLPFLPTKGEILTVEIEGLEIPDILSSGIFLMPVGENTYKLGSNYSWNDTSLTITPEVRNELEKKLSKLIKPVFRVIDQQSGIRPATKDRRPFLGTHSEHQQAHIFNGLGTKGVLLAPYFAKHLLNNLLNGSALHPEVDIKRFIGG